MFVMLLVNLVRKQCGRPAALNLAISPKLSTTKSDQPRLIKYPGRIRKTKSVVRIKVLDPHIIMTPILEPTCKPFMVMGRLYGRKPATFDRERRLISAKLGAESKTARYSATGCCGALITI